MKRKTIKKPKFWKTFLITFAIALVISMLGAKFYLDKRMDAIHEELNGAVSAYLDYAGQDTRMLLSANEEAYDSCYNQLEWTMCLIHGEGAYANVYVGDEKIIETTDVAPMMIALGNEDDSGTIEITDYYFLADMSLLDPINEYENGKFSLEKLAMKTIGLQYDTMAEELFDESTYDYNVLDIYVDQNTHRFYFGKVEIIENSDVSSWSTRVLATIDCSPEDTEGLKHVNKEDVVYTYVSFMNHYYDGTEFTEKDVVGYHTSSSYGKTYTINFSGLPKRSMMELLPVTFWVVICGAAGLALVVALVISILRYSKAKAVWDVFDYQKKTTEAMAHDLKTPLATISAYAEKLEDQITTVQEGDHPEVSSFDVEKATVNAAKIRENVSEMNSMLEGILEFSKTDRSNRTVKKEKVDLRELVETSASKCKVIFEKRGITVKIEGEEVSLTTDRDLLLQAIDNLFTNCGKYAQVSSVVEVTIDPKTLSIRNRTSEPVSNVEELKKPFVKGEKARGQNGTGLGLAIADNNLKLLGYSLGLKSDDEKFIATITF